MQHFFSRGRLALLASVAFSACAASSVSAGLQFSITYAPSVSGRADFASIQAANNYVAGEFSANYSDNITINILVKDSATVHGGTSIANFTSTTYSALRTNVLADRKTADDFSAAISLPATDPTPASSSFEVTNGEAKALGLLAAQAGGNDGTFTFSSTDPQTYDPNNRAVAGKDDFIGTAEHEFSEIMGRNEDLTTNSNSFQLYDLYRYKNGVQTFNPADANVFFSLDGGTTNLKLFNAQSNGGDIQDWDTSIPPDSFDASGGAGEASPLSSVDFRVMDILGYDRISATPEPASCGLLTVGGFGLLVRRRRSSK